VYHREYREPAYLQEIAKYNNAAVPEPADLLPVMKHLATHPNPLNPPTMTTMTTMTAKKPAPSLGGWLTQAL
jgi:hypothetical protein